MRSAAHRDADAPAKLWYLHFFLGTDIEGEGAAADLRKPATCRRQALAMITQQVLQELTPLTPERSAWIGGHGTEPYEQNTQQSPCFGRSIAPQPVHL